MNQFFLLFLLLTFVGKQTIAQTIEPLHDFYVAKKNLRKSHQTTQNTILFQGKDMITNTVFTAEYDQIIEKPTTKQQIRIVNKKYDGYVEIMGNKQEIKDNPEANKPIIIFVNQDGIIDSVNASEVILNQLKQTITSRIEKGKPNPHFLHVKNSKKIGDLWTDSSYVSNENNSYFVNYKFERQEGNLHVLSFQGDIKMLNDFEQNGVSFQTNVIGNSSGTIYVEPNTNYIVKSEGTMKLEGRMIVNTDEFPTVIKGTFKDDLITK